MPAQRKSKSSFLFVAWDLLIEVALSAWLGPEKPGMLVSKW